MTRWKLGVDGKPLEEAIQNQILDWLDVQAVGKGWKFWRARPSQYIRAQGSNVGFKLHPTEIGIPDIMGTAYGYTVGMEVKRPKGVLSQTQKNWRDDFLRVPRTAYYVVHSMEDAALALYTLWHASRENSPPIQ